MHSKARVKQLGVANEHRDFVVHIIQAFSGILKQNETTYEVLSDCSSLILTAACSDAYVHKYINITRFSDLRMDNDDDHKDITDCSFMLNTE